MPGRKATVFVGSSSEAEHIRINGQNEDIPSHFRSRLQQAASVVYWRSAPEFRATYSTLDGLFDAVDRYDFGLFVFTPDDRYMSRGHEGSMGRDNVLFEFGLFLGKLGPKRVFAVVQRGETDEEKLKIPTDLWGINMPQFAKVGGRDLISEIDRITTPICAAITKLGARPLELDPVVGWSFDSSTEVFTVNLDRRTLKEFREKVENPRFCLLVRKQDVFINNNEDRLIAKSLPRLLPNPLNDDVGIEVNTTDKIQSTSVGDMIDGYLLLIPVGCDVEACNTMQEMFDQGCEIVSDFGCKVKLQCRGTHDE